MSSSASDHDDTRLVGALIRGEAHARSALFERYGAHIQRVLAHLVGYGEPERADLLHDVFIRAFERIAELKNPTSLKHWLTRIAVFRTHEWFRKRKRTRQHQPLELIDDEWSTALEPEARAALRSLYALLERFEPDLRSVFVMRFVEGLGLQEVADICDVSLSTARRRVLEVDALFRQLLPEHPALLERLSGGQP